MYQVGVEHLAIVTQSVPSIELRLTRCALHSTQFNYKSDYNEAEVKSKLKEINRCT